MKGSTTRSKAMKWLENELIKLNVAHHSTDESVLFCYSTKADFKKKDKYLAVTFSNDVFFDESLEDEIKDHEIAEGIIKAKKLVLLSNKQSENYNALLEILAFLKISAPPVIYSNRHLEYSIELIEKTHQDYYEKVIDQININLASPEMRKNTFPLATSWQELLDDDCISFTDAQVYAKKILRLAIITFYARLNLSSIENKRDHLPQLSSFIDEKTALLNEALVTFKAKTNRVSHDIIERLLDLIKTDCVDIGFTPKTKTQFSLFEKPCTVTQMKYILDKLESTDLEIEQLKPKGLSISKSTSMKYPSFLIKSKTKIAVLHFDNKNLDYPNCKYDFIFHCCTIPSHKVDIVAEICNKLEVHMDFDIYFHKLELRKKEHARQKENAFMESATLFLDEFHPYEVQKEIIKAEINAQKGSIDKQLYLSVLDEIIPLAFRIQYRESSSLPARFCQTNSLHKKLSESLKKLVPGSTLSPCESLLKIAISDYAKNIINDLDPIAEIDKLNGITGEIL